MLSLIWRLTWRMALFWTALFSVSQGIARSQTPPDAADLAALLQAGAQCLEPCWLGIEPGVTTSMDALSILNSNAWIRDIHVLQSVVTTDRHVSWYWTGSQPAVIDPERFGQLWIRQGKVYAIELPLRARLNAIWRVMGQPRHVGFEQVMLKPLVLQRTLIYGDGKMVFNSLLPCPLEAWAALDASTVVKLTDRRNGETAVRLIDPSACRQR